MVDRWSLRVPLKGLEAFGLAVLSVLVLAGVTLLVIGVFGNGLSGFYSHLPAALVCLALSAIGGIIVRTARAGYRVSASGEEITVSMIRYRYDVSWSDIREIGLDDTRKRGATAWLSVKLAPGATLEKNPYYPPYYDSEREIWQLVRIPARQGRSDSFRGLADLAGAKWRRHI